MLAAAAQRCSLLLAGRRSQLARRPARADPVIAKVNGVEIHQSDLALAEEDIGQNPAAVTTQAKRDYLSTISPT